MPVVCSIKGQMADGEIATYQCELCKQIIPNTQSQPCSITTLARLPNVSIPCAGPPQRVSHFPGCDDVVEVLVRLDMVLSLTGGLEHGPAVQVPEADPAPRRDTERHIERRVMIWGARRREMTKDRGIH